MTHPPSAAPHRRSYPLHIHISTLFLVLVLAIGIVLSILNYQRSSEIVSQATDDLFVRIARETVSELEKLIRPADTATRLLAQQRAVRATNLNDRLDSLGYYVTALQANPSIVSFYAGYEDGDFFLVRRINSEAEQRTLQAPPGTAYVVQSIERDAVRPATAEYLYYDSALNLLGRQPRPEYLSYDPRQRGWYALAAQAPDVRRTDPYVFFTTGKVGITLTQRSPSGPATVGSDIQLDALAELLQRQRVTPASEVVIFDNAGRVVGYHDEERTVRRDPGTPTPRLSTVTELDAPALSHLVASVRSSPAGGKLEFDTADGRSWHSTVNLLQEQNDQKLYLGLAVPENELLAEVREARRRSLILFGGLVLLSIPLTIFSARLIARPLERLADEAEAVRHFDFSKPANVSSIVKEVADLADTMDGMKATIRRFLDITTTVAAEDDFSRLLPRLLDETASAAKAHSGVLYLATDNGALLTPAALRLRARCQAVAEPVAQALGNAPGVLREVISTINARAIAGRIDDAEAELFGLPALGLELHAERPVIAVALYNRKHQLVGAMLLFGAEEVESDRLSFITALSGSAAVSLESRELINAQKELFEAFIRLMASAIDAKSPYTGGHCARVPELTKMLVRAACDTTTGPYKDFQLTPDEWEAVHVAGWLHDCGKVTTPEYVVDKATKLETIYDRIHEVRMRFEVLKRDAEIGNLRKLLAGGDPATCATELDAALRTLDDEFAFVATCNEGGEFMAPEKVERLRQIAARTWQRTLDDRIGIAHEERTRKEDSPAVPLPATEALLADKPEHRIERREAERFGPGNPWGFRLDTPELLYNRGELYNLSVGRGTLSAEERYKINDHITQTIIMLSALPFPKHLQSVPELAGGHHEKMDGTGYPKRLTRDQMSPVARMMAIADIFEALTAADRPYKKGKTLSESLKIMSFMRRDQHIDPELFELFLRSGVHRSYAERYMRPEQIDEVDINAYL
ncbi:HD domain-containing phosphohydrolase [Uliginosibacterium sp. H1]|uniref:HD domain-containing phosphohydrolase n=1 Tax=Uliginosibacterium sp. H1 TaxID=3114757 RepID=UPI002E171D98|nr:HD domain-containing phosphohydrolase [Uliginosibacterium sp. H1]